MITPAGNFDDAAFKEILYARLEHITYLIYEYLRDEAARPRYRDDIRYRVLAEDALRLYLSVRAVEDGG